MLLPVEWLLLIHFIGTTISAVRTTLKRHRSQPTAPTLAGRREPVLRYLRKLTAIAVSIANIIVLAYTKKKANIAGPTTTYWAFVSGDGELQAQYPPVWPSDGDCITIAENGGIYASVLCILG